MSTIKPLFRIVSSGFEVILAVLSLIKAGFILILWIWVFLTVIGYF